MLKSGTRKLRSAWKTESEPLPIDKGRIFVSTAPKRTENQQSTLLTDEQLLKFLESKR